MTDDIVIGLRQIVDYEVFPDDTPYARVVADAANEIEHLRAEVDLWRNVSSILRECAVRTTKMPQLPFAMTGLIAYEKAVRGG